MNVHLVSGAATVLLPRPGRLMSALCAIIAVVNNAASITDLIIGCRHILAVGLLSAHGALGQEGLNQYVSVMTCSSPARCPDILTTHDSLLYIFSYAAVCIMYVALVQLKLNRPTFGIMSPCSYSSQSTTLPWWNQTVGH